MLLDPAATPNPASALRVLVVDDNEINREVLNGLLSHWGIDVQEACVGKQAVELVCANDCTYDIVLMDVMMPVMDGVTATGLIRRFERALGISETLPVVAYTAGDLNDDPGTLARTGFSAVLRKPTSPDRLRRCLQRWCAQKMDSMDFFGTTGFAELDALTAG